MPKRALVVRAVKKLDVDDEDEQGDSAKVKPAPKKKTKLSAPPVAIKRSPKQEATDSSEEEVRAPVNEEDEENSETKPVPKKRTEKKAPTAAKRSSKTARKLKKPEATDSFEEAEDEEPRVVYSGWQEKAEIVGKQVLDTAVDSDKHLGVHVSAAGGVHNAIHNAVSIGCRSFALFLKNQRRWDSKAMTEKDIKLWDDAVRETKFDVSKIVPHGSYLLNAASPVEGLRDKTRDALIDEVTRCQKLGILYYNFHPGSTTGKWSREEGIESIVTILDQVFEKTRDVTILVETMAGQNNIIGSKFEDLKDIIDGVDPKYTDRIGVCFDTCHVFAAGYDIRTKTTYENTMKEFDRIVGFKYLKAVHLNDSLGEFDSGRDRHAPINRGHLKSFFPLFMNDPRFDNLPLILETPDEGKYPNEMKYLYGLDRVKNE